MTDGAGSPPGDAATTGRALTAGELAVTNVPVAAPDTKAGEILGTLRSTDFAVVDPVIVCRERLILGAVPLARLLRASPTAPASSLMARPPTLLSANLDQEQAALAAVQAGGEALVVVDDDNRFLGLLPANAPPAGAHP